MKSIITLLASLVALATTATDPLDGHSASELIASWKTNQAGQIQSRNRPAATDIPHNLFLREEGAWQESKTQRKMALVTITATQFTNVVSGDNHTGCSTCDDITKNHWLIYHPWHEGGLPYIPATERWTITTVGVRHTATIPGWPGELVKKDITTCTTNREVLKSDWVKEEPAKSQVISGGGGGVGTITNVISKSITNTFYYEPIISDGTPPKFIKPLYSNAPTNGPDPTIWQYDSNRKWNKDIEELKRNTEAESKMVMEKTGESIVFVRGDGRVPFDFKTDANDIELGYKQDGTVTWRKTPERTKQ